MRNAQRLKRPAHRHLYVAFRREHGQPGQERPRLEDQVRGAIAPGATQLYRDVSVIYALDPNPSEAAKAQQVHIAADKDLGRGHDGTLQNAIVRRVGLDNLEVLCRFDQSRDHAQLPVGFRQPLRRAVELVPEHAEGLGEDRFGDGKVDLTVGGQIEKVFRFAAELQCTDEDIRISDDPFHDRARDSCTARSTMASTSASVMDPRRASPSRPMRSSQRRARSRSSAVAASFSTVVPSAAAAACTRS